VAVANIIVLVRPDINFHQKKNQIILKNNKLNLLA